jgi:hypothetical protein
MLTLYYDYKCDIIEWSMVSADENHSQNLPHSPCCYYSSLSLL